MILGGESPGQADLAVSPDEHHDDGPMSSFLDFPRLWHFGRPGDFAVTCDFSTHPEHFATSIKNEGEPGSFDLVCSRARSAAQ